MAMMGNRLDRTQQEAWDTFNAARVALESKHKDVIESLGKVDPIVS
jgi:hypothetical protein